MNKIEVGSPVKVSSLYSAYCGRVVSVPDGEDTRYRVAYLYPVEGNPFLRVSELVPGYSLYALSEGELEDWEDTRLDNYRKDAKRRVNTLLTDVELIDSYDRSRA